MANTAIDLESEALVRQLHRELNGLTRRRESGSAAVAASVQQLQRRRTKPQQPTASKPVQQAEKQADKVTSSFEKPSSTGGGSKRRVTVQDSGASGSDGEQRTAAAAADAKPGKKQRSEKPKEESAPAAPQPERKPHRLKQNADVKRPPSLAVKVEPEPAVGPSSQAPEQPPPATPAKTAIEAAAAAAADIVRLKAKAPKPEKGGTYSGGSTGPRHVKCFYAGVRWGILLPPDVLHSRSDLAAALNEAFEGEIVSCGRGERLIVVFIDEDGGVSELPSVRSSSSKENVNKWRQLANRAHRVYVRMAG